MRQPEYLSACFSALSAARSALSGFDAAASVARRSRLTSQQQGHSPCATPCCPSLALLGSTQSKLRLDIALDTTTPAKEADSPPVAGSAAHAFAPLLGGELFGRYHQCMALRICTRVSALVNCMCSTFCRSGDAINSAHVRGGARASQRASMSCRLPHIRPTSARGKAARVAVPTGVPSSNCAGGWSSVHATSCASGGPAATRHCSAAWLAIQSECGAAASHQRRRATAASAGLRAAGWHAMSLRWQLGGQPAGSAAQPVATSFTTSCAHTRRGSTSVLPARVVIVGGCGSRCRMSSTERLYSRCCADAPCVARTYTKPVLSIGAGVTPHGQPCARASAPAGGATHGTTLTCCPRSSVERWPSFRPSTGHAESSCISALKLSYGDWRTSASGLMVRCMSVSSESTLYPRATACPVSHHRCRKSRYGWVSVTSHRRPAAPSATSGMPTPE
mmetsp:Transcript_34935/g.86923  ORF Transcript_34935/g.86923 Transcript_34935/m.86923 type:complete len:449 (-) Transcript_34935:1898-3244(-)